MRVNRLVLLKETQYMYCEVMSPSAVELRCTYNVRDIFSWLPNLYNYRRKREKLGVQSSSDFMTIRFLSGLLRVTGRHLRQVNVVRKT